MDLSQDFEHSKDAEFTEVTMNCNGVIRTILIPLPKKPTQVSPHISTPVSGCLVTEQAIQGSESTHSKRKSTDLYIADNDSVTDFSSNVTGTFRSTSGLQENSLVAVPVKKKRRSGSTNNFEDAMSAVNKMADALLKGKSGGVPENEKYHQEQSVDTKLKNILQRQIEKARSQKNSDENLKKSFSSYRRHYHSEQQAYYKAKAAAAEQVCKSVTSLPLNAIPAKEVDLQISMVKTSAEHNTSKSATLALKANDLQNTPSIDAFSTSSSELKSLLLGNSSYNTTNSIARLATTYTVASNASGVSNITMAPLVKNTPITVPVNINSCSTQFSACDNVSLNHHKTEKFQITNVPSPTVKVEENEVQFTSLPILGVYQPTGPTQGKPKGKKRGRKKKEKPKETLQPKEETQSIKVGQPEETFQPHIAVQTSNGMILVPISTSPSKGHNTLTSAGVNVNSVTNNPIILNTQATPSAFVNSTNSNIPASISNVASTSQVFPGNIFQQNTNTLFQSSIVNSNMQQMSALLSGQLAANTQNTNIFQHPIGNQTLIPNQLQYQPLYKSQLLGQPGVVTNQLVRTNNDQLILMPNQSAIQPIQSVGNLPIMIPANQYDGSQIQTNNGNIANSTNMSAAANVSMHSGRVQTALASLQGNVTPQIIMNQPNQFNQNQPIVSQSQQIGNTPLLLQGLNNPIQQVGFTNPVSNNPPIIFPDHEKFNQCRNTTYLPLNSNSGQLNSVPNQVQQQTINLAPETSLVACSNSNDESNQLTTETDTDSDAPPPKVLMLADGKVASVLCKLDIGGKPHFLTQAEMGMVAIAVDSVVDGKVVFKAIGQSGSSNINSVPTGPSQNVHGNKINTQNNSQNNQVLPNNEACNSTNQITNNTEFGNNEMCSKIVDDGKNDPNIIQLDIDTEDTGHGDNPSHTDANNVINISDDDADDHIVEASATNESPTNASESSTVSNNAGLTTGTQNLSADSHQQIQSMIYKDHDNNKAYMTKASITDLVATTHSVDTVTHDETPAHTEDPSIIILDSSEPKSSNSSMVQVMGNKGDNPEGEHSNVAVEKKSESCIVLVEDEDGCLIVPVQNCSNMKTHDIFNVSAQNQDEQGEVLQNHNSVILQEDEKTISEYAPKEEKISDCNVRSNKTLEVESRKESEVSTILLEDSDDSDSRDTLESDSEEDDESASDDNYKPPCNISLKKLTERREVPKRSARNCRKKSVRDLIVEKNMLSEIEPQKRQRVKRNKNLVDKVLEEMSTCKTAELNGKSEQVEIDSHANNELEKYQKVCNNENTEIPKTLTMADGKNAIVVSQIKLNDKMHYLVQGDAGLIAIPCDSVIGNRVVMVIGEEVLKQHSKNHENVPSVCNSSLNGNEIGENVEKPKLNLTVPYMLSPLNTNARSDVNQMTNLNQNIVCGSNQMNNTRLPNQGQSNVLVPIDTTRNLLAQGTPFFGYTNQQSILLGGTNMGSNLMNNVNQFGNVIRPVNQLGSVVAGENQSGCIFVESNQENSVSSISSPPMQEQQGKTTTCITPNHQQNLQSNVLVPLQQTKPENNSKSQMQLKEIVNEACKLYPNDIQGRVKHIEELRLKYAQQTPPQIPMNKTNTVIAASQGHYNLNNILSKNIVLSGGHSAAEFTAFANTQYPNSASNPMPYNLILADEHSVTPSTAIPVPQYLYNQSNPVPGNIVLTDGHSVTANTAIPVGLCQYDPINPTSGKIVLVDERSQIANTANSQYQYNPINPMPGNKVLPDEHTPTANTTVSKSQCKYDQNSKIPENIVLADGSSAKVVAKIPVNGKDHYMTHTGTCLVTVAVDSVVGDKVVLGQQKLPPSEKVVLGQQKLLPKVNKLHAIKPKPPGAESNKMFVRNFKSRKSPLGPRIDKGKPRIDQGKHGNNSDHAKQAQKKKNLFSVHADIPKSLWPKPCSVVLEKLDLGQNPFKGFNNDETNEITSVAAKLRNGSLKGKFIPFSVQHIDYDLQLGISDLDINNSSETPANLDLSVNETDKSISGDSLGWSQNLSTEKVNYSAISADKSIADISQNSSMEQNFSAISADKTISDISQNSLSTQQNVLTKPADKTIPDMMIADARGKTGLPFDSQQRTCVSNPKIGLVRPMVRTEDT